MSMLAPMNQEGRCVCGAVRFRTSNDPLRVSICHCTWCQRRTGTAFGVEVVFNAADVAFTGQTMARYRHVSDETGRWLDSHFCPVCGANLGLTLEAVPGIRSLPAGAFDDPTWIRPDRQKFRQIFLRSRRVWSDITPLVETHEGHFRK
jgi:hypothetical protein